MPAHALAPEPGWDVLDACAAPGNKTTHLAGAGLHDAFFTCFFFVLHKKALLPAKKLSYSFQDTRVKVAAAYSVAISCYTIKILHLLNQYWCLQH